jgi:tripartite-type tricarboxylate transporter receptor subunit TctC
MKSFTRWLVAAFLAAATATVTAQASYPDRPIKLVVGFPAANATDVVARVLAEKLGRNLGQPVVVENRPGQGASIAAAHVAKAAPDGYTMMLTAAASMVTNPHLYKNLGYDPLKDLVPSVMLVEIPLALVAHPSAPFNTLAELIAYAKANPGKLSYSSSGNGTLSHLAMERLKREAGVSLVHIPYQGSGRSMTDLMAGTVHVAFDTLTVTVPHIEARKMKPIAVATQKRVSLLPGVPTMIESGVPEFIASPWLGIVFPAGTPHDILNRMQTEMLKVMDDPAVQKSLQATGSVPRINGLQEFGRIIREDHARWGKVVTESGVKID